ncbi:hypothetical protein [Pseudonocardia hydrocarbonoxydans]|uniref:Lipoprotein n=1 Tax=Pseudonocardia hydrocarbonoxydans TaxID=76726 RepID=A0A4Y3WIE2_9PSEU|nr:hypothetical protein [Pseudonocardia hydrocarbonoxydans]GEC18633.1 lipoprotein [Pseudonocardia hydrocarbonoxydans]
MATVRRGGAIAIGLTALVLALAACGGAAATATGSPAPPSAAPAPGAPPGAVDPNAPEVNAAGDIPDNQVFVPFSPPGGAFRVSVPEGWARSTDGAAVVFTDKFNSVRIESVPSPAAPDVASATAQEVPALASSVPGFQPGDVTAVQRKGGPAVLVTYTASSPADPVTGKSVRTAVERYEFWRGGQELIVTLSGPQGADNVDPWRIVSDSVGWL